MRSLMTVTCVAAAGLMLSACGSTGLNRTRPNEFAVARQAPLVIPPNYSLVPPQPGAVRNDRSSADQALNALYGGPAARSPAETGVIDKAGDSSVGIRSSVGDPDTSVIDKGTTTKDIVDAPAGDGQSARVTTP